MLETPGGMENKGMGQTGVSHAKNIYTVFWNPANNAALYDELQCNYVYSSYNKTIKNPELNWHKIADLLTEELKLNTKTFGFYLPQTLPFLDIGYTLLRNDLRFKSFIYHQNTQQIDTIDSKEEMVSNSFGLRFFDIISIGIGFKKYKVSFHQQLWQTQFYSLYKSEEKLFDLGFRISKEFLIFDLIELHPAIGLSFLNLGGPEIIYSIQEHFQGNTDVKKDTLLIENNRHFGISCDINLLDFFAYTIAYNSKNYYGDHHLGHRFQITPFFTLFRGYTGKKYDKNLQFSFNYRKTVDCFIKLRRFFDLHDNKNTIQRNERLENLISIKGFAIKPNFLISYTNSKYLHPYGDWNSKTVPRTSDLSIGVGLIGKFPNFFKFKASSEKLSKKIGEWIKEDIKKEKEKQKSKKKK